MITTAQPNFPGMILEGILGWEWLMCGSEFVSRLLLGCGLRGFVRPWNLWALSGLDSEDNFTKYGLTLNFLFYSFLKNYNTSVSKISREAFYNHNLQTVYV